MCAAGRWFGLVNYAIHMIMYSYFGLRAMGLSVPRCISMLITLLQLSQMALGVAIVFRVLVIRSKGEFCHSSVQNMALGGLIYFSYFLLFMNYFVRAYFGKGKKKKEE